MTRWRGRVAIRARLALLYTGLLAAALAAFGSGMYVVLAGELGQSFDAALRANAEHAAGAFSQDVEAAGGLRPTVRLVSQLASTGGRVVVLDAAGARLADSAPSGSAALPISSADLAAAARHAKAVWDVRIASEMARLTIEPISGPDGRIAGYVAWAASTASLEAVLSTVGAALLLGGAFVVGIALAAGLVVAGRALKPVADVTETARAIALSGDFGARVEGGEPGDEIGELALAFNEMLAALEDNHQALQRFLGDASHQLRTPLTVIRANLDLARRPDLADEERAAILADARDEAERMARLIGDLLSLARADSGARLEFERVELDALLVDAVRRQRLAAPHVRMSVAHVELALVDGDRDRLRELLGIVLDNAARYTPDGGSVAASLTVADRRAVIVVEDSGIGIDEEDREQLFERLHRGRRARQLRPSGTGLGLAIARWITSAHGGTIDLAPRAGQGTVVTITLPVAAP